MAASRKRARQRKSGVPRVWLALGLLAVGLIVVLGWLVLTPRTVATDPSAPGRLVASEATIDLGPVPFDKLAEARFELANTGGAPVRLTAPPRVRMLEGC